MNINLPYKVRASIYIANALLSPIVGYLVASKIIGADLAGLWAAEITAAFVLAGLNVKKVD